MIKVCDHGEVVNGVSLKTPSAERSVSVSEELINLVLDYVADVHDDTVTTNHIFLKLSLVAQYVTVPCVKL
jgi:hypothetical protein